MKYWNHFVTNLTFLRLCFVSMASPIGTAPRNEPSRYSVYDMLPSNRSTEHQILAYETTQQEPPSHITPEEKQHGDANMYPRTPVLVLHQSDGSRVLKYRFAIVADMDKKAKMDSPGSTWRSFIRRGTLQVHQFDMNPINSKVSIEWEHEEPIEVRGRLSFGGHGMELSELISYAGKILACDDRTGTVYEILDIYTSHPWVRPLVMLSAADGERNVMSNASHVFKCEWMTVREDLLFIGSNGRRTDPVNAYFNSWVKVVDPEGRQRSMDWSNVYERLIDRTMAQKSESNSGYMTHEAVVWSEYRRTWNFMPRKLSHTPYIKKLDGQRASNTLISGGDDLMNSTISVKSDMGSYSATHGVTSFRFVPETGQQIILALKAEELKGKPFRSFLTAFEITTGRTLMEEITIGDGSEGMEDHIKYEGLEFI